MSAFDRDDTLTAALRQIAREDAAIGTPASIEEQLLREFRTAAVRRRSRTVRRAAWIAAAAIVLFAVSVAVWRFAAPHRAPARAAVTSNPGAAQAVEARATPYVAPEAAAGVPPPQLRARTRAASSHVRRRPAASAASAEVVTDFMPLAYTDVPLAGGQLVRLRVPRSALAVFMLAPAGRVESGSRATVLADVIVGEDGLARAFRFVQPAAAQTTRRTE